MSCSCHHHLPKGADILNHIPENIATLNESEKHTCNRIEQRLFPNAKLDLSNPQRGLVNLDKACDPHRKVYINTLKDNRILENNRDIGDVSLRQNINSRYVRIENTSTTPVIVAVATDFNDIPSTNEGFDLNNLPHQGKMFLLGSLESRDLAVNMPGETPQYFLLYNPETRRMISTPLWLDPRVNLFAIVQGMNIWNIQTYHRSGF